MTTASQTSKGSLMNKLIGLLAATALCSLLAAAPASAGQEIQELQRVQCLAKTNPYTGGTIVAAKVHYIMGTIPNKKNNLRKLSFEVRLVPSGAAGIHWNRTWRKYELDKVSADGVNRKVMGSTTNYENAPAGSWDIQVRMTWHRRGKNDWEVNHQYNFNLLFCKQVG